MSVSVDSFADAVVEEVAVVGFGSSTASVMVIDSTIGQRLVHHSIIFSSTDLVMACQDSIVISSVASGFLAVVVATARPSS